MMLISDLFPRAGITFWDVAHECNAGMMADGFTRATGQMSMMVAQNGPGIINTSDAGEDGLLEPHAASSVTCGGQQDDWPGRFPGSRADGLFKDMVAYQEEVRDPSRSPRP